jgi:hypothetical protein
VFLALALCTALALEGDPAFDDGVKLYKALEYEQAVLRFQQIAVRPALAPPDKAEALLWLGLSYAGTADFDSARTYLKSALETDLDIALPDKVSPRVAELFHDLHDEVAAAKPPNGDKKPPPDTTTTTTTTVAPKLEKPGRISSGVVLGAVAGSVGVLALAGGAVSAALSAEDYKRAQDPNAFQVDAQAALDATNTELVAAAVLLPIGAALAAAGVMLVVTAE